MRFSRLALTLIVALTNFFVSLSAQAIPSDLAKMKTYRSYYHVQLEGKTAHQFEVWYEFMGEEDIYEWEVFQIAVQDSDDASRVTKDDYLPTYQAFAGWPKPPRDFTPVPAELKALEEGLKAAVRKNHSELDIKSIRVDYLSYAARLFAHELIPVSISESPESRLAVKSSRFYFANLVTGEVTASGSGFTATGLLNLDNYVGPKVQEPVWVNYVLPAQIEGSSLLSLDFREGAAPVYMDARKELISQIIQTGRLMEQGISFDRSIEKVLRRQGDTLLPEGFKQTLKFRVDIFGRTPEFADHLNEEVEFSIPVSDQPFSFENKNETTGFVLQISGDLSAKKPKIVLTVTAPDGTSKKAVLVSESEDFKLIKDGPRPLANGPLYLDIGEQELSFPGSGKYTAFEIYPDSYINVSLLTGP